MTERKELSENAKKTLATILGLHERFSGKITRKNPIFHSNYIQDQIFLTTKQEMRSLDVGRALSELSHEGYIEIKDGYSRGTSNNANAITHFYEFNPQKIEEAKKVLWR